MVRIAPTQIDQSGCMGAGPADGMYARVVVRQELVTDDLCEGCVESVRQILDRCGQVLRHQVPSRGVDRTTR